MLNVLIILVAAIAFNALFSWRRYPAALVRSIAVPAATGYEAISHEDFVYALTQMDSFIDISEEDLLRIYSCLLYTSPSPRDRTRSRTPSSA